MMKIWIGMLFGILFSSHMFGAENECVSSLRPDVQKKPEAIESSETLLEALRIYKPIDRLRYPPRNTVRYLKEVMTELVYLVEEKGWMEVRPPVGIEVRASAKRKDVLKALYEHRMVSADVLSFAMSDKLIMSKLLEHFLGAEKMSRYHPKTVGVIEYLQQKGFINEATGALSESPRTVQLAFEKDFPDGFIVKPTSGWSSKGRTFYKTVEEVIRGLFYDADNPLYSPEEFFEPYRSEDLGLVVSGERYLIQSKLGHTEGLSGSEDEKPTLREYRSHSLWGNVVPRSTKGRWIGDKPSDENRARVVGFLQDFLDSLPKGLTQGQAWSFDIVDMTGGQFGIVEINTNRGMMNHWSGSLHNPRILGAYTRHLRDQYLWRFKGISGFLLHNNFGNRARYKEHNRITRESHNGQ